MEARENACVLLDSDGADCYTILIEQPLAQQEGDRTNGGKSDGQICGKHYPSS
jgi:hypothetical protein